VQHSHATATLLASSDGRHGRTGGRALEDAALVVGGQAAVQREQPDLRVKRVREPVGTAKAAPSDRPRPMGETRVRTHLGLPELAATLQRLQQRKDLLRAGQEDLRHHKCPPRAAL